MKSFITILLIFILTASLTGIDVALLSLVITVPVCIARSKKRKKDPNHTPWWCSLRL